ncbi:hypothetical protein PCURB6_42860 [Paenibacillus curdlanolyticus]|nr:hypothetical protein PCURB6_42860 [Paenibacillus curdlanolyticus]
MGGAGLVTDNLNLKKNAGNPNLTYNLKDNLLFKADDHNLAYEVSATQIPARYGWRFDSRLIYDQGTNSRAALAPECVGAGRRH